MYDLSSSHSGKGRVGLTRELGLDERVKLQALGASNDLVWFDERPTEEDAVELLEWGEVEGSVGDPDTGRRGGLDLVGRALPFQCALDECREELFGADQDEYRHAQLSGREAQRP